MFGKGAGKRGEKKEEGAVAGCAVAVIVAGCGTGDGHGCGCGWLLCGCVCGWPAVSMLSEVCWLVGRLCGLGGHGCGWPLYGVSVAGWL